MTVLNIAEIPYEDGSLHFRYARVLSPDGSRWLRHGLFQAFHPNGEKAAEGHYNDGEEQGPWREYHANGQIAAEGEYEKGVESGSWKYWSPDGRPEVARSGG